MIASLRGVVASVNLNSAVVEVGGVGILVHLTGRHAQTLRVGAIATLSTSLLVREDSLTLFGFESESERSLFELLQTVTGIGPKVAQSALSAFEVEALTVAIATENFAFLEKIPGLGKKGASRLVLELKEKVQSGTNSLHSVQGVWRDQLVEALTGLGFSTRESNDVIEQVHQEFPDAVNQPLENLLKIALQIRGRK